MMVLMRVRVAVRMAAVRMLVSVVPELGLVEQKEKHQAYQQRGKQCLRANAAFKGFRQQVHEGRGQQRARRQAEQVPRPNPIAAAAQARPHQQGGHPHTADARRQGGEHNYYKNHSYKCLFIKRQRHFLSQILLHQRTP